MKGILIGHSNTERTGVTVVMSKEGAVGGVSVRGSAPGTRETDLLKSENSVEKINAVVLSGGSAFGLATSHGVMRYLSEQNFGFSVGYHRVPIVCSAVLFDLNHPELNYPDEKMGYLAAKTAAQDNYSSGNIGAGTGATVGKILGMNGASRGGLGIARVNTARAEVMAIVAVNAFGDVYDPNKNEIIAGAKLPDGNYLDTVKFMLSNDIGMLKGGTNTTIGVICTNAKLTKPQANKLADVAHDGLAHTIRPVHTMMDGDTLFAMATCDVEEEFNTLCVAAVEAMSQAVLLSVGQQTQTAD